MRTRQRRDGPLHLSGQNADAMKLNPPEFELRAHARLALAESRPEAKVAAVRMLDHRWIEPSVKLEAPEAPGRPDRPKLVPPAEVPRRDPRTREGRAALLHAIAHIEWNAINLALDAIVRFAGLPEAFYRDWLQVAKEEAKHFTLLAEHLASLGYAYGDFPAHNGLWEMAEKTRADVLARMALVPRTLEARGLDASPAIRDKLAQAGDARGAAILDVILRDEIGHVAIGNRWFRHLCAERGLDPMAAYAALAQAHRAPRLRGPFNLEARRAAGFTREELEALSAAG
ncbi:MAG: ferritin-like domain-containing protein [Burkholderiales bacterium]|nr:ferritin-like domain-containing protein [Burkholderiales bacterium]